MNNDDNEEGNDKEKQEVKGSKESYIVKKETIRSEENNMMDMDNRKHDINKMKENMISKMNEIQNVTKRIKENGRKLKEKLEN